MNRAALLMGYVCALLASGAHAQEIPIEWLDRVGVSVSGTAISKAHPEGWNARAISRQTLGGSGYVEFAPASTDGTQVLGLARQVVGTGPEELDFAVRLNATGTFDVIERGTLRYSGGSYAQGDRFRISVAGAQVQYRHNGATVYTSATALAGRHQFAYTPFTAASGIEEAVISGSILEGVEWTAHVNAQSSGNDLWKTTTTAGWNSGAVSTRGIASADGYVEATATTGRVQMFGLSNGDTNANHPDIDFALYTAGSTLYVYESGAQRASFGSFANGDVLRVAVEAGVVKYRKNGTLLYTSGVAPVYPLLVDTSMEASGARIDDAVIAGSLVAVAVARPTFSVGSGLYATPQTVVITGEAGSTIHYTTNGATPTESDPSIASGSSVLVETDTTLRARAFAAGLIPSGTTTAIYTLGTATTEPVEWTAHVNAQSSGNDLWKTTTTAGWNSGAVSTRGIVSADGYVEAIATTGRTQMFGLSNGDTNANHPDIDFALYTAGSTLYVYESGAQRASFGSFANGDVLRVAVEAGVVKYRKNGALLYTSGVAPVYPLLVDTSMESSGARIDEVVIAGSLVSVAVARPTFSVGSGLYATSQTVVITGEAGSTIHYTTNGATPTESDPSIASGASLLIETDTTLRARAFAAGLIPSGTTTAIYTFGPATTESVEWTAHVNAQSSGNDLWKTTTTAGWNSGAVSTRGIVSADGYVEAAATTGRVQMFGLSNGDTNANHPDIDFALYMAGSTLYVYESGAQRASVGSFANGDVLRVAVEAGVVKYRKNGALLYTSGIAPVYPLLVDTSMESSGARIDDVVITGSLVAVAVARPTFSIGSGLYATAQTVVITGDAGSTIHYTTNGATPTESDPSMTSGSGLLIETNSTLKAKAFAPGLIPSGTTTAIYTFGTATTEPVEWTAHVNAQSSGNDLWKTTTTAGWNSGAVSTRGIASADGYVEATATTGRVQMFGLSNGDANANHPDIDFALYTAGTTVYVYESGAQRASFGSFANGDVLRVAVEAGVVKYRKNGALLYTSGVAPVYPLLVDTSMESSGARIDDAVISGSLVSVAVARPTFSVGSGLYATSQTVVITGEAGSTIHYTTNGATPTESDPSIASGASLLIETDTTLRARAFAAGLIPSGTTTAIYTLGTATTEPVEWTAHVNAQSSGNDLWKTTTTAGWNSGAVSTRGIVSADGYVEAIATAGRTQMFGLSNGDTNANHPDIDFALYTAGSTLYVYESGTQRASLGSFANGDVLRVAVEAGVVRYRKNGALLYTSGVAPVYPLLVDTSMESSNARIDDTMISGHLVDIRPPIVFTPPAGVYAGDISVALTTPAPNAVIRFTADGSNPTASSPVYSAPIEVPAGSPATIKAFATAPGYLTGAIATATYTFAASTPTITPDGGAFENSVAVSLATSTSGASVRYTLDGSEPTATSDLYTGPIVVAAPLVLKARAFHATLEPSSTASAAFDILAAAPSITASPGASAPLDVSMATTTPGAVIRYTTDGSDPSPGSTAYAAPVPIFATTTFKARAFAAPLSPSAVSTATFEVTFVVTPVLSQATGKWTTERTVNVSTATPGADLHYTTDGTEPTVMSPVVPAGGNLLISKPTSLKVRGFKGGLLPSATIRGNYLVTGQVAGGDAHSLILKADGTVWAAGSNGFGQLGDGTQTQRNAPVQVLTGAIFIAAGRNHSLAVKSDGTVWAWGQNSSNQLGDGTTTMRLSPVQIAGLSGAVGVAGGNTHSLAVLANGTVRAWGANGNFQLGTGGTANASTPVATAVLTDAVEVAAGDFHSMARTATGAVYTWGTSAQGQLGAGATSSRLSPGVIASLTGVTSISARASSSYVVTGSGATATLWSFGLNDSGQLGDGTLTNRSTPVSVVTGVSQIAAGGLHLAYVANTSRLWAVGQGNFFQLGDGVAMRRTRPIRSRITLAVVTTGQGLTHGLNVGQTGTLIGVGRNANGQLGLGNTTAVTVPTTAPSFLVFDGAGLDLDLDGDGLDLYREILFGTDPMDLDTNGNGVSDGDEVLTAGNPALNDADLDGLANEDEIFAGTDPFDPDTDNDGALDGADSFPLDPTKNALTPTPGDLTPPTITLQRPIANPIP